MANPVPTEIICPPGKSVCTSNSEKLSGIENLTNVIGGTLSTSGIKVLSELLVNLINSTTETV